MVNGTWRRVDAAGPLHASSKLAPDPALLATANALLVKAARFADAPDGRGGRI